MRVKNIIFDFDGVIHNTFEFHLENVNEVYDIGLTEDEYRSMHDGNFYDNRLQKTENLDWTIYSNRVKDAQAKLVIKADIKSGLVCLSNNNNLFLVTSGFRSQVFPYLANNKVVNLFKVLLFAEDDPSKEKKFLHIFREHGSDMSQYIFVTDTLGDILEANKVGLKTIAVTFGFHDREHLMTGRPEAIVDSWEELMTELAA